MSKMRIYELAKQIEKDNAEIVALLKENGIEVKNHMSSIDDAAIEIVKAAFAPKAAPKVEAPKAETKKEAAPKPENKPNDKKPVDKKYNDNKTQDNKPNSKNNNKNNNNNNNNNNDNGNGATEKPTDKATETEAPSGALPVEEKKGCGSVIGSGMVALCATVGLSAAVVIKKKRRK